MKILKKTLILFAVYLAGLSTAFIPDFINLYNDHVMKTYRNKTCDAKNHPEKCDFFAWYNTYENENPKLSEIHGFFMMSDTYFYMAVSGKCSNHIFWNVNAAPRDSGKITNREYFFSHCGRFTNWLSDLIYQYGDQERMFDPKKEHL